MCGVAGIARCGARPVEPDALAAMAAAMRHRGPDGTGIHVGPRIGLAHTRLSIVDPEGGAQPMGACGGRWTIVYNGEVYNHAALRRELEARGHRFRTRCDTEVVLRGWAEWGEGVLHRLDGQFAFAVHDRDLGTVHLARDRFGVRPLYWALRRGDLAFASEPAALFASGEVDPEPDPLGVDEVFTCWAARAPRTVFRDVQALPPGCVARWRAGAITVRRWYEIDFPDAGDDGGWDASNAVEALDEAISGSVAARMRADVPVGAYLSGGLDSSAVCALAAGLTPLGLRTFSVTFDDPSLDESPFQREVAARIGTVHAARAVSPDDVAHVFPDVVRHAATPLVRAAPAPMYLLARHTREARIKVVLTGEGADELFLGYDLFREAAVRRFCLRHPGSRARARLFDRLYPYLAGQRGDAWRRSFLAAGDADDPLFSHLPRFLLTGRIREFYSADARAAVEGTSALDSLRASLPGRFGRWAPAHRAAWLEMATLLEPYLLASQGDRMSLAHGVEGRYPFLDHRVFELAASLPPRLKLAGLREKAVLRRWAAPRVPPSVLARPKQPYRAPDVAALAGPRRPAWVDELLDARTIAESGWFEPRAVAALAARCRAGRATTTRESQALVAVLSTQLWHRAYFGAARPRAAIHPSTIRLVRETAPEPLLAGATPS